ncbi:MAG: 4-hydroxy-3-methylbut-2-enyl diphosphate reductase, partial [Firmicutes bacterium]|nr:4-hydroxy-3-methylbut-2-enyl diphosphate reductase [Bacillota bacterium]
MIEIKRAENSGFCFGVKRALMKTEEQIGKTDGKPIYTCGPLIHNRFVTDDLESRGVKIIDRLEQAGAGDIVIVRSHGEPADFFEEAECRGIQIVNATCPFVSKIHTLARKAWEDGYQVVIVGDRNHPEVRGIAGWCGNEAVIVANAEEADAIREDNLFLVCQTTIRKETLDTVVNILQQKGKEITVRNTICSATTDRQNGCIALAAKSDAMVIVGGKESSNTRKLWEISKNYCENSYFVEKIEDLPLQQLRKCNKIGIAAGASTPECVIKEVIATMSENITEMNMQDLMEDIEKS